jgi:hypothetical protein
MVDMSTMDRLVVRVRTLCKGATSRSLCKVVDDLELDDGLR